MRHSPLTWLYQPLVILSECRTNRKEHRLRINQGQLRSGHLSAFCEEIGQTNQVSHYCWPLRLYVGSIESIWMMRLIKGFPKRVVVSGQLCFCPVAKHPRVDLAVYLVLAWCLQCYEIQVNPEIDRSSLTRPRGPVNVSQPSKEQNQCCITYAFILWCITGCNAFSPLVWYWDMPSRWTKTLLNQCDSNM